MPRKILMPVRTVADWGGVHEWTVEAAKALIANGNEVTFVGEGELFQQRVEATGAYFYPITWNKTKEHTNQILEDVDFDLIFSHAPAGRELGLRLSRKKPTEHVVMVHGAYHDRMFEWQSEVDAFLAASPSLVHFVQRYGRVDPWKVTCLPNAAPDRLFTQRPISLKEKTADGEAIILTASRLSTDKIPQIDAVERVARFLANREPDLKWRILAYGDGPARTYFEARYRNLCREIPNLSVSLPGWLSPDEVPLAMRRAVVVVTAGMAGMRAAGSGTLMVGAGANATVGAQFGTNLRAGLWSNFGDHGIQRFQPTEIESDLEYIWAADVYDVVTTTTQNVLAATHQQSMIDRLMLGALQCV